MEQAIENASSCLCAQLALSLRMSQLNQISTEETGKTEFYTSFVSSIVAIH